MMKFWKALCTSMPGLEGYKISLISLYRYHIWTLDIVSFRYIDIISVTSKISVIFTGRPARSTAMPVLFLFSGPKMFFCPTGATRCPEFDTPPCQISRLSGQKCGNIAVK